jgi:hypothetical protein
VNRARYLLPGRRECARSFHGRCFRREP